jgi:protein-S-isoprenylcysteine O-methyltransferase Ste14
MKETAYLLQAALIIAWWFGLATSEDFFDAFQFPEIGEKAFWSFLAPDLLVIALLSLIRAYRSVPLLEHIVLGGFAYGTLYCLNASLLTSSGYLPTALMIAGLGYNVFLCFGDSLFRQAESRGTAVNLARTAVQVICMWFLFLGVVPWILMVSFGTFEMPGWSFRSISGLLLFAGFSILGLSSAWILVRDGEGTPLPLDQTRKLVIRGPYRHVRNPMAIAGIGQGISISVIFASIPVLVYSLLGAFVWHLVVKPVEERDMLDRFGESWLRYRNRVSCWLPAFRAPSSSDFPEGD